MIQEENKEKNGTEFFGFNYDKIFKAIFVSSNATDYNLLCQLLNEAIEEKIDKITGFIPPVLASKNVKERYKRVDLLAEAAGKILMPNLILLMMKQVEFAI